MKETGSERPHFARGQHSSRTYEMTTLKQLGLLRLVTRHPGTATRAGTREVEIVYGQDSVRAIRSKL